MNPVSTDREALKIQEVENFLTTDLAIFKRRLAELEAEIDKAAEPRRNDALHAKVLDAFEGSQDDCRKFEEANSEFPEVVKDVQRGLRQETLPWFNQSWIGHRARSKPSGFAGDYEMLIKLYNEATPARGLGGYLDLCIMELPLARAVRARLRAAREFLIAEIGRRGGDVRILDIASGPCREYLDWPEIPGQGKVEIVAMDNDPQALAFVDANVANQLPSNTVLRTARYNALRTRSADATIRNFGKFDIIYSVGLCDYLPDDQLIAMLSAWRATLNDGGVMYVAFKDTLQYDKTPYQWHLDWFFFQRTQEDCLRLFELAGFDINAMELTRDATGIIINFISRHGSSTTGQTDKEAASELNAPSPSVTNSPAEE